MPNTNYTIVYTGLDPASSYTIMVTMVNDNERMPRLMSDELMAKIELITDAGSSGIVVDYGEWLVVLVAYFIF